MPHDSLAALRALVAEKFPPSAPEAFGRWRTGEEIFDQYGGLRRGSITEICGSAAGTQIALCALLGAAARESFFLGLIDAANAFEPADWPDEFLSRLLWVRGGGAGPSLKAADLLLRDGNLPMLVLDLQPLPLRHLRRIPASTWHRFQRVIEHSATILAILTPQPLVEGAPCRIALRTEARLEALNRLRTDLIKNLEAQIFERGRPELQPLRVLA